jgi:anti-sigma B factor antagonist
MTFNIEEKIENDVAILTLHGKMLAPETSKVSERVRDLVEENINKIVIDLHGIKRMNSAFGLGVLMTCFFIVNRSRGQLRLANLTKKELKILKITKLDHIFKIYENVQDAVNSMNTK